MHETAFREGAMADEKLTPLSDRRATCDAAPAGKLETKAHKVQRLMIELAALVDKRRTGTRPENYATVDAQIAATEAELRKLEEAPKLPPIGDFEQKGNTTEHVIEMRKQAATPHQNRGGKTEPSAQ